MQTDIDDQTLSNWIQATAENDQASFEKLYLATSPYAFALLRRMLQADSLAEEALQEVFVKVWNKAASYDSEKSAPRTWIISIARHHAIDELRKRSTREDVEINMDYIDLARMPLQSVPFAEQHEHAQRLDLCLELLDASARECVVRAYCEGFSHEELSQQEQRPVNTIKSVVRRGLLSLKECLDEH